MRVIYTFLIVLSVLTLRAQVFTGTGGDITDNLSTIIFTMEVSGLPEKTSNSFGLEKVCINIKHTWIGDLGIRIQSPGGRVFTLVESNGGDADDFDNACFAQYGEESVLRIRDFKNDTYRPLGDMGSLNDGSNPNGTWKIIFVDYYPADAGTLIDWSLTFSDQPAVPQIERESKLPIVKIETDLINIIDDPKKIARMHIIDNQDGNINYADDTTYAYSSFIGIELRGSSSQGFPKKSYGFETWDANEEEIDVSLFGMPAESDWIFNAHYADKTLIRNNFTYELSRRMGHYAPRTKLVELYLNGEYKGVYSFMEKIKRNKNRVNIPKVSKDANSGSDLTGGYIFKIDRVNGSGTDGWASSFEIPNRPGKYTNFLYEYPKDKDITVAQASYLQNFVYSFEYALNEAGFQDPKEGWRKYADELSFIDFMLAQEMSKNVDGYRLSTFLYKTRDTEDNKIHIGPVWDFDIAWTNADYCDAYNPEGWAFNNNYVCGDGNSPFWWEKFMQDTMFRFNLNCRWESLRQGLLSDQAIFGLLDSYADTLQEASDRNFKAWDIMGHYVWPNPSPIPSTFKGEYGKLKGWMVSRFDWMDEMISKDVPVLTLGFKTTQLNELNYRFELNRELEGTYSWSFGDGNSSADQQPSHTYAKAGNYDVVLTITSPFGCEIIHTEVVKIGELSTIENELSQFSIHPNPTTGNITIETPFHLEKASYEILDIHGTVIKKDVFNREINISDLQVGAYQFKLITPNAVAIKKIIKI